MKCLGILQLTVAVRSPPPAPQRPARIFLTGLDEDPLVEDACRQYNLGFAGYGLQHVRGCFTAAFDKSEVRVAWKRRQKVKREGEAVSGREQRKESL